MLPKLVHQLVVLTIQAEQRLEVSMARLVKLSRLHVMLVLLVVVLQRVLFMVYLQMYLHVLSTLVHQLVILLIQTEQHLKVSMERLDKLPLLHVMLGLLVVVLQGVLSVVHLQLYLYVLVILVHLQVTSPIPTKQMPEVSMEEPKKV